MFDTLLGLGGKLIDTFMGSKKAEENNATQLAIAEQNRQMQKEFAQNAIQWKVKDAETAGLHPLAALGAQVSSYSPVSVGDLATPSTDFGGMGQSIGRALDATAESSDRHSKMQTAVGRVAQTFQLEKMNLENEVLKTDIALKRAQLPPPFPVPLPRPGPNRTVGGVAVQDDDIKQKAEDHPQTAIVRPFGYPLRANPWFSDGQQFEDRYGESEIGSTLKFGVNTLADHAYTGYMDWLPSMGEYVSNYYKKRGNKPPRTFPYYR